MASSKETEMGLLMVIVTILWVRATAQSGCTSVLIGMAPCLSYITGNSSTPASSCCSQLANVVQTQPRCLCSVLNGGAASLGITINQTQALALPNACNVQTPPVSQCNAVNGPTTSPADSPAGSPADSSADSFVDSPDISPTDSSTDSSTSPSVSTIPAGAGSKTVPSTTGVVSHGSSTKKPLQLVFFLLFTASCASTFTSF